MKLDQIRCFVGMLDTGYLLLADRRGPHPDRSQEQAVHQLLPVGVARAGRTGLSLLLASLLVAHHQQEVGNRCFYNHRFV